MKKESLFILVLAAVVSVPVFIMLVPGLLPLLLIAGIIYLKGNYADIKGSMGEWKVNQALSQLDSQYTIFHDVYLPSENGGTTQIDHVVTSPYGIFVIETKNYDGWIFGKENQKYWMQVIYKRKEKLYNPIWQNYGHIQALKTYIGYGNEDSNSFHSIIAFSKSSTLKFQDNFKSARVIQIPQLAQVIQESNVHKISVFELQKINQDLRKLLITDKKEKRQLKKQHVQAIKAKLSEKERKEKEKVRNHVCPKCGGALSLKKGKYGSFYGCRNYPKCRYSKKVVRGAS
jgi:ribosomal protein L32